MSVTYTRAPITEAVIEFKLTSPLDPQKPAALQRRFKAPQWGTAELRQFGVQITLPGQPTLLNTPIGFQNTSAAGDFVVGNRIDGLSISQLPPYPGWDKFIDAVEPIYRHWRKATAEAKLSRIGVRYLNRIDIPVSSGVDPDVRDYFSFVTAPPPFLDAPLIGFGVQINGGIRDPRLGVNLNFNRTVPELYNHTSFSLDVDVYRDVDVPQRDSEIWALLSEIRAVRTTVFESCITDKTRELIL